MNNTVPDNTEEVLALVREAKELARAAAEEARAMAEKIEAWKVEVRHGS